MSLFVEEVSPESFDIPCPTFSLVDVLSWNGPVIATTLRAAEELAKSATVSKKYFYIHDLEWVHIEHKDFQKVAKIYREPSLTLIARSNEYAEYIRNAFGVKIKTVMPKLHIQSFL